MLRQSTAVDVELTPRIAILGAGAAGTIAAVHLLRETAGRPFEIDLIDRRGTFGLGAAYATADPAHLLNVPAVRMGAISGHPEHFHDWASRRGVGSGEAAFLPRGLFGVYLVDLLAATEKAAPRATLRRLRDEALAVRGRSTEGSLEVELRDGGRVAYDAVLLAPGPLAGTDPVPIRDELRESGAYVEDPWVSGVLDGSRGEETVLLLGTGLTMVDVALALTADRDGPRLLAISRRGLLPRAHHRTLTRLAPFELPGADGLDAIFATVSAELRRASASGREWRDVIDSARTPTPAAWRALPLADKRRFLTEVNRYWDVHRFRTAPDVAEKIGALVDRARLQVGAGEILAVEPYRRGARVRVRRQAGDVDLIAVDRVINCTGAGTDITKSPPPLLRSLFEEGLARSDSLGLGLDVAPSGMAIAADGREDPRLHVVGALRRGVEWEAIGVTEIRDHAAAVASILTANHLPGVAPAPRTSAG
jgi:uncharacterized NAD(P)/FAD-binding protein YdhS